MFDHSEYIQFHHDLARSHKELQDSAHQRSFVGVNTEEFNQLLQAEECHKNIMHMLALRGQLGFDKSENITDTVVGGFVVLVLPSDPADYMSEQTAFDKAKKIGIEILLKIQHDTVEVCPRFLKLFDFNKVEYHMTDHYLGNFVGYRFEYPLERNKSAEYNPETWL